AGHGLFEALAGDAVDAGIWRGGDDLVTALAQNGDGLRADQAGAADDDDLHLTGQIGRRRLASAVRRHVREQRTEPAAMVGYARMASRSFGGDVRAGAPTCWRSTTAVLRPGSRHVPRQVLAAHCRCRGSISRTVRVEP